MTDFEKEVQETIEQLEKEYNFKFKVHAIVGEQDGKSVAMYLREPDYAVKRKAFNIIIKDQTDVLSVGEYILSSCVIPDAGVDFFGDAFNGIAAAMQAANLIEMNNTLEVFKKK